MAGPNPFDPHDSASSGPLRFEIDSGRPLGEADRQKLATMSDAEKLLRGYGLTTAEFVYGLPDSPSVLNTYLWQQYDLRPDFPVLFDFIAFWEREIEGPLRAVSFTHCAKLRSGEWRQLRGIFDIPPRPDHA